MSSGGRRKVFRLSRRGNRRLNHAIHVAAVTQIRFRHTDGRAYYDRKIAEGHSGKAVAGGWATGGSSARRVGHARR